MALTTVALLALAGALPLWLLVVVLAFGSCLRLAAVSGCRLLATDLAGEHGRLAVNGLLGTSDNLASYVIGPVLGGVLAVAGGPDLVLALDGLSFLPLTAAVRLAIPAGPGPAAHGLSAASTSGWAVLRRVPLAAWLFLVVFCFNLFYMPVEVALPLLVRGPLHSGASDLGKIWTAFGAGALLGALATPRLRRAPQTILLVAIIAGWALCTAALATVPNVLTAAIALALGGLIYAPFTPVAYTLVQDHLQPDQQQPVLTLWAAGSAVAAPIGLLLAGPLVGLAGIRTSLLISAAFTLALVPVAVRAFARAAGPAMPPPVHRSDRRSPAAWHTSA